MREQLDFLGQLTTPADEQEIRRCRTCGRPVIWLVTPNGAPLPVDAIGAAVLGGAMMWREGRSFGMVRPGEVGYNSHLATCGRQKQG